MTEEIIFLTDDELDAAEKLIPRENDGGRDPREYWVTVRCSTGQFNKTITGHSVKIVRKEANAIAREHTAEYGHGAGITASGWTPG